MLFLTRCKVRVSHQKTRARVPAQNGIVVAWRPTRLGLLITNHRLSNPLVSYKSATGATQVQQSPGAPLRNDAGIISALVFITKSRQQRAGCAPARPGAVCELIGDGEQKRDNGLLVVGITAKNVETDALGPLRLASKGAARPARPS